MTDATHVRGEIVVGQPLRYFHSLSHAGYRYGVISERFDLMVKVFRDAGQ